MSTLAESQESLQTQSCSPSQAAQELLARRGAKKSLASFIDYIDYGVIPAKHHKLIIEKLEAIERGEIKRLMLFLPPGSAKSTYASVLFPSWYLGRNPQKAIIGASNTGELSETFGRRVRNIVAQQEYSNVFNVTLSPDSQAAGRWSMTNQSEYYAVGIGGSVVGRRSDLGIIDDPVKSREDAESELSRNKVWDWYKTDFYTRLKPNAAVILIMCMTGDTPVLMADGKEKPLREIKVGDNVATYENGRLKNSKVLNHSSNGDDFIYRITMSSGKVVRANERHPFLVEEHGGLKWVQLKDLTIAHKIVTLRGSGGNGKAKPVWSVSYTHLQMRFTL